mmetsp:Transcript_6861/g.25305  ORF Transcript_6861/g.25305 Transcript_6861/m.25305 type:complete len:260 (+) Transcript_6861:138-917(+)
MKKEKEEPLKQQRIDRKPRYISQLLKKAKEREFEMDIIYERQVAKERAADEHLYGDKEQFVTSAYKQKLQEREQWMAEEKQREVEEQRNDVTKRNDLSDLYRNLLSAKEPVSLAHKPKAPQERHEAAPGDTAVATSARGAQQPQDDGHADRTISSGKRLASIAQEKAVGPQRPPVDGHCTGEEGSEQPGGTEASGSAAGPAAPVSDAPTTIPVLSAPHPQVQQQQPPPALAVHQPRKSEDAVNAARERYLARKRQKTGS